MLLSGCSHLLHNAEFMVSLEESHFDALLTDPFLPCGSIVAQFLALPAVYFLNALPCGLDLEATQCPVPLSYVPKSMSVNSDRMNFLQRVKNVLIALSENLLCNVVYSPYASLATEILHKEVTVKDLLSYGSIWLMRNDFVRDYPRPIMPNMVFIGGINCLQKKPLSQVCIWVGPLPAHVLSGKEPSIGMCWAHWACWDGFKCLSFVNFSLLNLPVLNLSVLGILFWLTSLYTVFWRTVSWAFCSVEFSLMQLKLIVRRTVVFGMLFGEHSCVLWSLPLTGALDSGTSSSNLMQLLF